jgi:hypothetical protein
MSPFNLESALSGKPVVTRDGREVKQITRFNADQELWPVAAVVDELVYLFTLQGKAGEEHRPMPHDLFMA